MYYEFEGRYNMETLIFDEDCLMVGDKCYPYSEIESLQITSAQLFSNYGILTAVVNGKEIPVPFPRSYSAKIKRAIKEMEREQSKKRELNEAAADADIAARPSASLDPYEEVKKLKELLDLDIITKEEFERKKKELLKL